MKTSKRLIIATIIVVIVAMGGSSLFLLRKPRNTVIQRDAKRLGMNLFVDHDPFAILVSEYNQPKEDFAVYVAGCQLAFGCRTEKDGARTASITVGTAGTVTITFTTNSAPKLLQTCLFKGSDVFLDDGAEGTYNRKFCLTRKGVTEVLDMRAHNSPNNNDQSRTNVSEAGPYLVAP